MRRKNAGRLVSIILANGLFESQSPYVSNVCIAWTGAEP